MRARECAFRVAEEFGFDQFLWQRGAVYFDEVFFGAQAIVVDRIGDQFFARAGFADDEDVGV